MEVTDNIWCSTYNKVLTKPAGAQDPELSRTKERGQGRKAGRFKEEQEAVAGRFTRMGEPKTG